MTRSPDASSPADDAGRDDAGEHPPSLLDAEAEVSLGDVLHALDALPDAVAVFDRAWRLRYVNPAAAGWLRSLRVEPAQVLGRRLWDAIPSTADTRFHAAAERASAERRMLTFEEYFAPLDRFLETRIVPTSAGFITLARDVTEQRRRERMTAILDEASGAFVSLLDARAIADAMARRLVPGLADWVVVDLIDAEHGGVVRAAQRHRDAEGQALLQEMTRRFPPRREQPTLAAPVVATGEPLVLADVSEEELRRFVPDEAQRRMARALGVRSAVVAPLAARGRLLGVVAVLSGARRYGTNVLAAVVELARRASLAIDNAQLYRAALAANEAKVDFLATVSHELRTPLTAIIGYGELLADGISGPITETQGVQLRRIQASARHLLQLIDEILSFSRLEAAQETVRRDTVDVGALLEEVGVMITPSVRDRRLTLRVEPPASPVTLETDAGKVRQILINLLSNAIKFTDPGGEVAAGARADAEHVWLHVRDTGIGIPPEHRERIFEPFWQVEQKATRRVGGTGLGLSVSVRLARLLGGELLVDSAPGAGSTFTLRLPRQARR